MTEQIKDGLYLWQYANEEGLAVVIEAGRAIVPADVREVPLREILASDCTLTPLVAMTDERRAAIRYAADVLAMAGARGGEPAAHLAALDAMIAEVDGPA